MTIAVYAISLGCPKNRVDTETMLACLGPDMVAAEEPAGADLVLVNTCAFIEPATSESLETIIGVIDVMGGLDPRPVLAVTGCLVGRYGPLAEQFPEVDLWLSNRDIGAWPGMIAKALDRPENPAPAPSRAISTGPSYAYLKIAEGCGHNCAFCTIPSIRGPLTSSSADMLVHQAREILDQNVPELILVAQDSTSYGQDLGLKHGLRDLLDRLLPLDGLSRLRLMYLYPAGLTTDFLDYLAQAGPPLAPYFDTPLQHSHPDILRAMGRPFARDPRITLDRIRERMPRAAVRTTLITGFPGETDHHFGHLADFVARARFHHLGVFAYCDESDAPSASFPDKVPAEVAAERRDAIMEIQAEISAETMAGYLGEHLDIVVDEPHPEWPGLHTGRTWFQAPDIDGLTYVSGPGVAPGKIVRAEITDTKTYDLVALAD